MKKEEKYKSIDEVRLPYYVDASHNGFQVDAPPEKLVDMTKEDMLLYNINTYISSYVIKYNSYIEELLRTFYPVNTNGITKIKKDLSIINYIIENNQKFIFTTPNIQTKSIFTLDAVLAFCILIDLSGNLMSVCISRYFKDALDYVVPVHAGDKPGIDVIRSKIRPDTASSWIASLTGIKYITKYYKMPVLIVNTEEHYPYLQLVKSMRKRSKHGQIEALGRNIVNDFMLMRELKFDHEFDLDCFYMIKYNALGKINNAIIPKYRYTIQKLYSAKEYYNVDTGGNYGKFR